MKLIDRIDLSRAGVYYFREILREYGIDDIGLNRHHLINVVARIIVAEKQYEQYWTQRKKRNSTPSLTCFDENVRQSHQSKNRRNRRRITHKGEKQWHRLPLSENDYGTRSCDLFRFLLERGVVHETSPRSAKTDSELKHPDAIRRWQKDKEWEIALQNVNYTGDRSFDTQIPFETPSARKTRNAGETFEKARQIYIEALRNAEPKHRLATIAAKATGLTPRRIRNWARQFRWADTQKKE